MTALLSAGRLFAWVALVTLSVGVAVGCKDAEKAKPPPVGPAGLEGAPPPGRAQPAGSTSTTKPSPATASTRAKGDTRVITAEATQPLPANTDVAEGERVAAASARVLAQLALLRELEKIEGKKLTGLEPSRRLQGVKERVQKGDGAVTVVLELILPPSPQAR